MLCALENASVISGAGHIDLLDSETLAASDRPGQIEISLDEVRGMLTRLEWDPDSEC